MEAGTGVERRPATHGGSGLLDSSMSALFEYVHAGGHIVLGRVHEKRAIARRDNTRERLEGFILFVVLVFELIVRQGNAQASVAPEHRTSTVDAGEGTRLALVIALAGRGVKAV